MKLKLAAYLLICLALLPAPLFAASGFAQDTNRFSYGFQRILLAPFRIPIHAYQGTMYGPPLIGTLSGVLTGTVRTLTDVVGGTFDMAAAAAPYAKYAALAI